MPIKMTCCKSKQSDDCFAIQQVVTQSELVILYATKQFYFLKNPMKYKLPLKREDVHGLWTARLCSKAAC